MLSLSYVSLLSVALSGSVDCLVLCLVRVRLDQVVGVRSVVVSPTIVDLTPDIIFLLL